MVTGGELGPILRPALASVTGKVTCDLLGVARVVTRVWVAGMAGRVLCVVTGEVVTRTAWLCLWLGSQGWMFWQLSER